MYILFADSGSTKTEWIITDKNYNYVSHFNTIGLNPYFVTEKRIYDEINSAYPTIPSVSLIEKLYFYGSGCEERDDQPHLKNALKKIFKNSEVHVFSDMLGAARAILKSDFGIAAIIGTGTNSCLYDGNNIIQNAISLGYILGDEGSGAYIGKIFVKNYLERKFNETLNNQILIETGATHSSILNAIYTMPNPSKFLAGFCSFIYQHLEELSLQSIVNDCFNSFFEKYITIFRNYNTFPLGFCGGISKNFRNIIFNTAKTYGFENIIFIDNPLKEIIEYHKIIDLCL
ncbi:MAG: hypothetical protein LBV69_03305 [Bacteroidales bacterium]|jgi:N-acetylglucosamine kinase-like BadF-type ATPase|nr:hypothetical protein [Bacteroidales bacterium]